MAKGNLKAMQVDGPDEADANAFLPDQQAPTTDTSTDGSLVLPDQNPKLQAMHVAAQTTNADENAQVLSIAKQTGQPPAFVANNLPAAKQAAAAPPASFFAEIEKNYPGTTQFLSKPENMAVAHDDLPNVAKHEGVIQQAKMASGFLQEADAAWQHSLGGLFTGGKPTLNQDPNAPWYDKIGSIPAGLAGDLPFMVAGGAAGTFAGEPIGIAAGSVAGPVGAAVGAVAGPFVGAAMGGFGAPAALKKGILEHYDKGDITGTDDLINRTEDILKEFGKQTAVGLAVQATGGLTKLAAGVVGKATGDIVQTGVDEAGKAVFRQTARAATATTAASLATEAGAMEVAGKGVEGEKPTLSGYLENILTLGAMHGLGALPPVEAAKAAVGKAALSVMGDAAKDSKLNQRSPEAYQSYVNQITDNGKVYIPVQAADSYFQSKNLDPETVMGQIGAGDSYTEAKQTGGDIEIPLAQWLSKVAGTEHFQGLLDHTRFLDQDIMTADEVRQKHEDATARFQAISDAKDQAIAHASENADTDIPEQSPIYQEVFKQLTDAGTPEADAKRYALFHDKLWSTLGERYGMSPEQLASEFHLEVTRGIVDETGRGNFAENVAAQTQDGAELDQSAYHGSPHKFDKFSTDNIGTGEGVQAYGHGLYFAGDKAVAEHYRNVLAKTELKTADGQPLPDIMGRDENTGRHFLKSAFASEKDPGMAYATAKNDIRSRLKEATDNDMSLNKEIYSNALKHVEKLEKQGVTAEKSGHLYTVEIPDHHEYLDFDKPLNEQSPQVRRALSQLGDINSGSKPGKVSTSEWGIVDKENEYWDTEAPKFKSKKEAQKWLDNPTGEQFINYLEREQGSPEAASQTLLELGIPGTRYLDASSRDSGKGSHNYVVFHDDHVEIKSYEQPGDTSPRGMIKIGDKQFNISLFKDADRSTFLHETGHMFLEVMKNLAERDGAPEQIKNDFQSIRDWMGLKDGEAIGSEQHEQWARGFESYLMEGKAPSDSMRATFGIFRRWLTKLYTTYKNLNVELSPEIRGVMDRMVATDKEIQRASALSGYEMRDLPDVPEEMRDKIRDLQAKARDQAEAQLLKEQMKEVTAEHRLALDVERQRLEAIARPEVEKLPIFSAIKELSFDGEKNVDTYALAEKGMRGEFTPEESAHFEVTAEQHGFTDGHELAEKIIEAKDNGQFNAEVKARVAVGLEAHADLKDTNKIREKALEAIHTDKTTELLALEREALATLVKEYPEKQAVIKRRRLEAKIEAQAAKDFAQKTLADKTIKDAGNPRIYVTAERKAAERAARALVKKDYEAATQAKREQLLNHAMAAEAMKNRTEITKTVSKLGDIAQRNNLKDMPYAFSRQIDQVLSRFGLKDRVPEDTETLAITAKDMDAKGESPNSIADSTGLKKDQTGRFVPETLSDFVARVNDNYFAMSLPDTLMSGAEKPYRELKLSELRELRDGAQSLQKVGQFIDRYLESDRKMSIQEAARQFRAGVEAEFGKPYADSLLPGSSNTSKFQELVEKMSNIPAAFDRALDTISTTCRKLDGLKDGPAQENISRPLQAASDRKILRTHDAVERVEATIAKHYTPDEFAKYRETRIRTGTRANGDPEVFTKEQILSMALNTGNDGNRQRLLTGFGWDEGKLQSVLSHLDKKDWDFAQDTWDHLNEYWPEIKKMEMDVAGVDPKGVESRAFTNEHGEYRGGYYPINYDFEKSNEAFKNAEELSALYKQFSTAKAATEQGHTEARTSYVNRPLRLSLDVLKDHHENVIHDLEFRRAVIDVSRFLSQGDVKTSLTNALGIKGYSAIGDWLKDAASPPGEALSMGEQAARWFRFNTTMFMMAYNVKSLFRIGPENLVNISSELGVPGAARAMKNYWFGDKGIHDSVMEKSPFMMERATHLDRDQSDMTEALMGKKQSAFKRYAFAIHAYSDQAVSVPLWHDVYSRETGTGTEEKLAVTKADEAVRRAFMSGSETNQSKAMRGPEWMKFLTVAFGYQSMMWNRFSEQKFAISKAISQGSYSDAALLTARATAYTFVMPALITALSRELTHNSQQENQDDAKKRMVEAAIDDGTPLKFIPVLRNVTPYVVEGMMGEHRQGFQMSPMEGALDTLMRPAFDLGSAAFGGKQLSDKFPEHAVNAASFAAGFPKSSNDLIFNYLDWQKTNGSATWQDFIGSRRSKK